MSLLRSFCISAVVSLFSCQNERVVSIQVHVKDESGKAISNASINLNGTEIGRSDTSGLFTTNIAVKKGEHRIEVLKKSSDTKFAPFQQNIMMYRDTDANIEIDATLYSTPQWSYQTEEDDFPLKEKEQLAQTVVESTAANSQAVDAKEPESKVEQVAQVKGSKKFEKVDHLIASGDSEGALKLLRKISRKSPKYIQASHKMGDIYLNHLDDPEKALEIYEELTKIPEIKRYDNSKFLPIYVNKAIAYFQLGEASNSNKKKSTRLFKNTLWITKKASNLLKENNEYADLSESVYYYKALAAHNLWLLNKNPALASNAKKEWTQYQKLAKRSKNKKNSNFLANSEVYLKQVKL